MAEATKTMAVPATFDFEGRTYTVTPFNYGMVAEFEAWLEKRAWAKVEATRESCSPEEYQRRLDAIARLIATDQFAYGSEAASRAAASHAGQRHMLELQLRPNHPDRAGYVAGKLYQEGFEKHLAEVRAKIAAGELDPNLRAPSEPGPTT